MIQNRFPSLVAAKEAAERRRIYNNEISEQTGVSELAVGRWRNDTVRQYHAVVLDAFCKYLSCQVGDLLVYIPDEEEGRGDD